jgi:flagellar hook-basal body complex protein FliE
VIPAIDPSTILGAGSGAGTGSGGSEWQVQGIGGLTPADLAPTDGSAPASGSDGFGGMLAQEVGKLSDLQDTAASASQSLADGTATDPSSVVVAVEKAQLAMQLAGQIRTKGAEAIQDIFHTQI